MFPCIALLIKREGLFTHKVRLHPCWCKNTSSQKRAKRGTCLHRFSLLSYLSSQSLKNFSWGACSSSGFSLHKSTNCLSKESWKLSNFEAIFASKSVTPSLRLLSWVKSYPMILCAWPVTSCTFVQRFLLVKLSRSVTVTKAFLGRRKENRHIPQHFIISPFIVCRTAR